MSGARKKAAEPLPRPRRGASGGKIMKGSAAERDAILRQDFTSFIEKVFATVCPGQIYSPNWHIEVIADRLEACRLGRIKRLIITLPPRYLKSIIGSVAFPAFLLGHDPTARIICASYAQDLAEKHAQDCRSVMLERWYHQVFARTRLSNLKNTAAEFVTTARGFRLATSVGGTLTGRGGNYIIIDDALKPQDALSDAKREEANSWFEQTLYSRLDSKSDSVIIVIMQRLHVDDLVGHLLRGSENWVHLNLSAIAPAPQRFELADGRVLVRAAGAPLHAAREPLPVLARVKAAMPFRRNTFKTPRLSKATSSNGRGSLSIPHHRCDNRTISSCIRGTRLPRPTKCIVIRCALSGCIEMERVTFSMCTGSGSSTLC